MHTVTAPKLTLNDSHPIPQLGLGVFQLPADSVRRLVAHALNTGYRLIDTAASYHNEDGVGEAIRTSGLARSEVFVTTKLFNTEHARSSAERAFERSLERLGTGYIDLYLIHWPVPTQGRFVEAWETLCRLRRDGRARSIGVSNFRIEDLERIIDATGVVPAINQVELHPRFQQSELRAYHGEHGILTEAWGPLGRGASVDEEPIVRIARAHGRTPAQVILRWHIQLGNVAIPKTSTPVRIVENFRIFDFALSEDEMATIAGLDDPHGRVGPDPATYVRPSSALATP